MDIKRYLPHFRPALPPTPFSSSPKLPFRFTPPLSSPLYTRKGCNLLRPELWTCLAAILTCPLRPWPRYGIWSFFPFWVLNRLIQFLRYVLGSNSCPRVRSVANQNICFKVLVCEMIRSIVTILLGYIVFPFSNLCNPRCCKRSTYYYYYPSDLTNHLTIPVRKTRRLYLVSKLKLITSTTNSCIWSKKETSVNM